MFEIFYNKLKYKTTAKQINTMSLMKLQSNITNLLHTYYTILGLQTSDLNEQLLSQLREIEDLLNLLEQKQLKNSKNKENSTTIEHRVESGCIDFTDTNTSQKNPEDDLKEKKGEIKRRKESNEKLKAKKPKKKKRSINFKP